jgi:acyl-CoA dehydrogenase
VLRTSALPNVVHLEDCRIPVEQRLGPEGAGLNLCLNLLTGLRFPYSACNVGVGVAALRMATDYAKQRKTFGELLARRQAIQWMLADSEVELRAARWLTWEGAWKSDRGEDARMEASIAKLYSSEVLGGWWIARCRFMGDTASVRNSRSSDGIGKRASAELAKDPRKSIAW